MKTKVRFSEVPMAEKLKVEYVDIGTLKPYAGNAKRHPGGDFIMGGVDDYGPG